jgi:hypothetical protein
LSIIKALPKKEGKEEYIYVTIFFKTIDAGIRAIIIDSLTDADYD